MDFRLQSILLTNGGHMAQENQQAAGQGQKGSSQEVDANKNFSSSQDQRTSQKDMPQDSQKWSSDKQAPKTGTDSQTESARQQSGQKQSK